MVVLGDVLRSPRAYQPDMVVFVREASGEVTLSTLVSILQHGSYGDEDVRGCWYLLEPGAIDEVIEGLKERLGRNPTPSQALRAVLYYAEHDALPELAAVGEPQSEHRPFRLHSRRGQRAPRGCG